MDCLGIDAKLINNKNSHFVCRDELIHCTNCEENVKRSKAKISEDYHYICPKCKKVIY